jgi:dTDP-4-dehydrorhamnose reductase
MILVTGATGFVGQKIMELCSDTVACPSLRGASEDDIKRLIDRYEVDAIIHTAAISDVGVCQADPDASYDANVRLPVALAKAAKQAKLICFSSDQVYGGMDSDGPYTEAQAKPANVYAEHKLEMEQRVLEIAPNGVMLRAEWMYGYYLKKSNYFMNVINATEQLAFSSRQYRGVTYVKEVAENMPKVIELPGGVYNFGSETKQTIYDITADFLALLGKDIRLEDAPPRHNLWMNCGKARQLGVTFSAVEDGLRRCAADCGQIER